ncbi:hypothetical protein Cs7R123_05110 [Catellatospora sp. TT07R-123]|uniref:discoidin domain-containing protein n=1 Tax=Catellatospora sp. TT07R-123 TaxID=2733863 RepID=UPI001B11B1C0|nr:discoidin domain-containing protein [Catellatospora sp. TT07R-123]GHJ43169.1 hypothetical protein Cs7R123_05110 [Catellatospora sp. TT07R-123]
MTPCRASGLLTAVFAVAATLTVPAPAAAAASPQTIPALQQWTVGSGSYTFTSTSRVVVNLAYAGQLADEGQTLADDLSTDQGRTVSMIQSSSPVTGDIYLTLGGADANAEGYTMTVGATIGISARTDVGAFYGTRTVLQLLRQSASVPAGTAKDWPVKPERGLMIDQGRKFFTVAWVRNHIRELAYLRMNYLHLHLSDNFGFRLESATHPEVVSTQHYTKAEIGSLVALGQKYHVTIVPEIDTPGHMDAILAAHPELKLKNSSGTASNSFIDLSLAGSYTLIGDLINEYLPLFPAPYWHLGADEYVTDYAQYPQLLTYARAHYGSGATAKDTYYGYINWANGLVRTGGKTMRMWNDGIKSGDGTLSPAANIIVEYWYNYGLTPAQLVAAGHLVANESWDPTYYVLGGSKPNSQWGYETWSPDLFQGGNTISDGTRNLGTNIHVWCDNPNAETEEQVAAGIRYPLRVLAQQTWGSPKLVAAYSSFTTIADTIGHSPGWPTVSLPGDLALNRPVTASSTETPSFPSSAAVDGDGATRWSSAYADPSWIQVDLGSTVSIGRVILRWETAYGRAYQIQTSNDGSAWTTVYSTTTGDGGVDDLTGLAGSGRYVRMYGTARGTTYGYSLYEFEVYPGTPNLARNRPVTVSSTETADFPGSYAVDGDTSTRWSSAYADPSWIQIDLGATQTVKHIILRWETAYGRSYQIQTSNDGTTWTTAYSTSTGDGGADDLTGLTASGRYLRVYGTQRATQWGYSLYEVEAYAV